jgi:hypothetical protein
MRRALTLCALGAVAIVNGLLLPNHQRADISGCNQLGPCDAVFKIAFSLMLIAMAAAGSANARAAGDHPQPASPRPHPDRARPTAQLRRDAVDRTTGFRHADLARGRKCPSLHGSDLRRSRAASPGVSRVRRPGTSWPHLTGILLRSSSKRAGRASWCSPSRGEPVAPHRCSDRATRRALRAEAPPGCIAPRLPGASRRSHLGHRLRSTIAFDSCTRTAGASPLRGTNCAHRRGMRRDTTRS